MDAAQAAMATLAEAVYSTNVVHTHQCGFDDDIRAMIHGVNYQNLATSVVEGAFGLGIGSDDAKQQLEHCEELSNSVDVAVQKEFQTAAEGC